LVLAVLDLLTTLQILCLQLLHHWAAVAALGAPAEAVVEQADLALLHMGLALAVRVLAVLAVKERTVALAFMEADLPPVAVAVEVAHTNREQTDIIGLPAVVDKVYKLAYPVQQLIMLVVAEVAHHLMAAVVEEVEVEEVQVLLIHPGPMELQELLIPAVVEVVDMVEITIMQVAAMEPMEVLVL
jgi:hypothetical protein